MLRNDVSARVALVDDNLGMEPRRRELEVDLHRERVNDLSILNKSPEHSAASNLAFRLCQCVKGVGNVLGVKRLAVAPENAIAQLVRQCRRIVVVLKARREPRIGVTVQAVGVVKRLVEECNALLVRAADGVRTPHAEVNALPEAGASDHRATPRDRGHDLDFHFALDFYLDSLNYNGLPSHLNLHLDWNFNLHFALDFNLDCLHHDLLARYLYLPLYLYSLDNHSLARYLNWHLNCDNPLNDSFLTGNDDGDRLRRAAGNYASCDQPARYDADQASNAQAQLISFHLS